MNILRNDADVEERVAIRIGRQVREFRSIVRGTGLVLQGRCRTYNAKQLAWIPMQKKLPNVFGAFWLFFHYNPAVCRSLWGLPIYRFPRL